MQASTRSCGWRCERPRSDQAHRVLPLRSAEATVTGEPVRVSVCHCLNCKKRSGSAFAVQARWPAEQVQIEGRSNSFRKVADSGNWATFHFCPDCGSDVHYDNDGKFDEQIAIPLGAFDDPYFLSPKFSVWEERKHEWVEILGEDVEHSH